MVSAAATKAPTKAGSGIPETQAAAAAKEAAVDAGKPNRIRVAMPRGCGFEATLLVGKVIDPTRTKDNVTGWWVSGDLKSPMPGKSKKFPAGKEFANEAAAIAAGFNELGSWLETHKLLSTKVAAKVRDVLVAVDSHLQRLLGSSAPKPAPEPKSSIPLAQRVNAAPLEQLDLSRVKPSPQNMRKEFDPAYIDELAESIKTHGLNQPITVYRVGGGWELIAGECRYRAGLKAKMKTLPGRVVDCNSAEARELRMIENLKRRDLTAIEEAHGYQTLLTENGYTQQQLAETIGSTQSTISKRLALLKLPEPLQELIIRREITESHAHALNDLPPHPVLAKHLAKAIRQELKEEPSLPSLRQDWPRWLYSTAKEIARTVEPKDNYSIRQKDHSWRSGQVLFTEKTILAHEKELDLIQLKAPWDKAPERFALNLKKWDELHIPLEKEAKSRSAQREDKAEAKGEKKAAPTAAEIKARHTLQDRQLQKRIGEYRDSWIQKAAAKACQKLTHDQGISLLIAFAAMSDQRRRRDAALQAAVKEVYGRSDNRNPIPVVLSCPKEKLLAVAKGAIARWLSQPVTDYGNDLQSSDLPYVAELLDVDVERDWRLDEEFLLLHSKRQLGGLAADWKIEVRLESGRTELVAEFLAKDKAKRLPAPKALLKGGAK